MKATESDSSTIVDVALGVVTHGDGRVLLAGFLHHRVGSTDIISLGGAANSMPLLTALFFLFGLAAWECRGPTVFRRNSC